ncbi:MAG: rhomboid family intramembrane serine protease [Acidimicrobiia bacterium]
MSSLPPPPPPPTCTRHPGREAGRACTRCGRPFCSECLAQATVGSQCVECRRDARPPTAERVRRWNATRKLLVTRALIVINVAFFVYLIIEDSGAAGGRSVTQGTFDLGLNRVFIANGEWWRLITAGFIHFGLIHIGFNMYALWNLGLMLEDAMGRARFGALYMAALLAGSAGVLVVGGNGISGGASGAVFGLFGAAAVGLQQRGVNPLQTSIGTVLLLNLVLTFAIPGISIGGHLGGLIGGAICGFAMFAPPWKRVPSWLVWATPAAVIAGSVIISYAVSG